MRKLDKIIDNLLSESISKRADELAEKIKGKVNMDEDIDPTDLEVEGEYDYRKSEDEPSERIIFKGRIPHGGKFETKNSNKKMIFTNKMIKNRINRPSNDEFEIEMGEGNKFTGALANAKQQGKDYFEVDGETYKVETNEEKYSDKQMFIARQAKPKNKIDAKDFKVLRDKKKKQVKEDLGGMEDYHPSFGGMNLMNPSDEDKETIEKYLRRYIKRDHNKFEKNDDTFDMEDDFMGFETLEESSVYRVSISENYHVDLTENELVDMIENIINEEQITSNVKGGKAKGLVQYDRVHDKDGDTNRKALKDIEKKMKEYVKAGSKGNFEMNPKHFPKGNGELGEMSKKAYQASDAVEEYIENFAYSPGMENLKYDEIEPNDEWLTANIEGSEKTGNSPKYANAVETDLGKKINKKRKENLYQKEVEKSYKRVKQPVDTAGEDKKEGKLDKMFSKLGESKEESANLITEEMTKMKRLFSYGQKTQ
jgi:hypothetical protein